MIRTQNTKKPHGFALPTVMIASVVMLMVLLSGLVSASTVNSSLRAQYLTKINKDAGQAGAAMAKACVAKDGKANWTTTKPLKPNTDCSGNDLFACPAGSTVAGCYVLNASNFKSSFTVGLNGTVMEVTAIVNNTRSSSNIATTQDKVSYNVDFKGPVVDYQNLISMAEEYSCAINTVGQAYCWGTGANNALGNGATTSKLAPTAVSQGARPAAVTYKNIAAGNRTTCGHGSDNELYCWGYNGTGQLGNGNTTTAPAPVKVLQGVRPAGVTFSDVSVGIYSGAGGTTCATGSNGMAYCWGYNFHGELGTGTTTNASSPVLVQPGARPASVKYDTISVGAYHTCGLGDDKQIYCWGDNQWGQLGTGTTTDSLTPVKVAQGARPAGVDFMDVSLGPYHACGLGTNYQAYCWGFNDTSGPLGNNTTTSSYSPSLVVQGARPAGVGFKTISAAGANHTCGLGTDSNMYCWGIGAFGGNGNGTTTTSIIPVLVSQGSRPAGVTFSYIATGYDHFCGIGSNGTIYCWGRNTWGELGNGTTGNSSLPVTVQGITTNVPKGTTSPSALIY